MCKNYLEPISEGMLAEIQEYGIDCSDAKLQSVLSSTSQVVIDTEDMNILAGTSGSDGVSDHYTTVVFVLIWAIFLITVGLVILQCKRRCNE